MGYDEFQELLKTLDCIKKPVIDTPNGKRYAFRHLEERKAAGVGKNGTLGYDKSPKTCNKCNSPDHLAQKCNSKYVPHWSAEKIKQHERKRGADGDAKQIAKKAKAESTKELKAITAQLNKMSEDNKEQSLKIQAMEQLRLEEDFRHMAPPSAPSRAQMAAPRVPAPNTYQARYAALRQAAGVGPDASAASEPQVQG